MEMSSSTRTENKVEIVGDKNEKVTSYIMLVQPDFYQASIMISKRKNFLKRMLMSARRR